MLLKRSLTVLAAMLLLAGQGVSPAADDAAAKADQRGARTKPQEGALSMVVMDPLAAPLSCPCVAGYAQRKYEVLAAHVEKALGRPVTLTFAESLDKALKKEGCTTAHLIIGKDSVVRSDGERCGFKVTPLAQLTGLDGETTQTGLIVVPAKDPAKSVADLKDYKIIFGPSDCSEKSSAARTMLEAAGVELPPPDKVEVSMACSDGACKIIEWGEGVRGAAVISSYAAPLLEGCGTIKKGDLRVVAETEPVPFITAFVTDKLGTAEQKKIKQLLEDSSSQPELLTALESMLGFVALEEEYFESVKTSKPAQNKQAPEKETSPTSTSTDSADAATGAPGSGKEAASWPGWRGPERDGRAPWLPQQLGDAPKVVWRQPLARSGLGGVAATDDYVVIGDRDAANAMDVWRCYSAVDGAELWKLEYPAAGKLDYDNAPRATPQIAGDLVYVCGAFGDLRCVDLATGVPLWETNIRTQFGASDELIWGCCASPLVVDEMVILNPGAPEASFVALDAYTGEVMWQSPGDIHAFASPIVAELGGVRQIVAMDRTSACGLDIETGRRLWTLKPPYEGDFNVPTPVVVGDKLLLVSENNGARLYAFDGSGAIRPEPVAKYADLRPDMSTPVAVGDRVFCVWEKLECLDASDLRRMWVGEDDAYPDYASVVASDDRLLILGRGGELLLVDAKADSYQLVGRMPLFTDPLELEANPFSHPAICGARLYVRGERELLCLDLGEER